MARRKSAEDPCVKLGWEDLEDWVGSRIVQRGKRYQQNGCVSLTGPDTRGRGDRMVAFTRPVPGQREAAS
jgi:uncharacterized Zn finger protein